jgi:hypothetical protein
MGAFRAQKISVHEQPVEEDFDATRSHKYPDLQSFFSAAG